MSIWDSLNSQKSFRVVVVGYDVTLFTLLHKTNLSYRSDECGSNTWNTDLPLIGVLRDG